MIRIGLSSVGDGRAGRFSRRNENGNELAAGGAETGTGRLLLGTNGKTVSYIGQTQRPIFNCSWLLDGLIANLHTSTDQSLHHLRPPPPSSASARPPPHAHPRPVSTPPLLRLRLLRHHPLLIVLPSSLAAATPARPLHLVLLVLQLPVHPPPLCALPPSASPPPVGLIPGQLKARRPVA
jgi:hypothetical protein